MYLIDSDILIFLLRGDSKVTNSFKAHAADPKAISVVSYGELLHGAVKSMRPVENAAKVRRLGELLPVIDVSSPVMETFAPLKAKLEKQGKRVDDFDLIVAATAIHLSYTLVTNNVRHFQHIPELPIDNWAE